MRRAAVAPPGLRGQNRPGGSPGHGRDLRPGAGPGDAEAAAVCTDDVRLTAQGFDRAWTGAAGTAALLDAAASRWGEHGTIPHRPVDLPDGRVPMLASVSGRTARARTGYTVACSARVRRRPPQPRGLRSRQAAFAAAGLSAAEVRDLGAGDAGGRPAGA